MKAFTPTQHTLVNKLADGLCHSGQHLGDALGISRTAIWKHIERLEALGLEIERIPKQGYRLKRSFIPLSEQAIRKYISQPLNHALNLQVLASVDSTNRFLKNQDLKPGLTLCASETQTTGRGRFARHWHSPFGENIYCSLAWRFEGCPSNLSGLSLVVSLALHAAIQEFNQDIAIKWPNDLLWNHKKLAGILIEMTGEGNGNTDVIIGIGLNVNAIAEKNTPIDKPWCALRDMTKQAIDRNPLLARLITQLDQHLQGFSEHGFQAYQAQWQKLDYLFDRRITVSRHHEKLTGRAQGVDNAGHLQLIDERGVTHTLSSGDTSLAQKRS
ncbi:MAG: biotin--[acetyl-CoA-carboxylase] ligase [Legionellaceae bacterium]|nr:biotin--[acetyl-CoA-carboxylase] ligase [Legionellaceae bacterium]